MRRGKGAKEDKKTLISSEIDGAGEEKEGRFFACYLLTSLSPRFKGHTYIGFTVNPRRRIRQHNGEIGCGAWRTKKKRPWEMVLCIYGFPTNVAALQFEWAWQHPVESVAVRSAAASFKSLSGIANKIKLAFTMLSLPAWNSLNLVVNFFSTKYRNHTSACPTLPRQMRTQICAMDELPCYNEINNSCDDLGSDEDCDSTDILQELTKESIEAANKASDSPSCQGFEENFPNLNHISEKDDTSYELSFSSKEKWIGMKSLQHTREEDNKYSSPPNRAGSSFVTSFCNIASYIEDKQIPVSVEVLDKKQLTTTTFVPCKDPFSIKKPCLPYKVEVIDIFTPSPCHRASSGSKKRKATAYPEIIDLTNSPMSV
ncbi:hypothetical protein F511_04837 [Dorcoceras hygrometricum]|uniref:Structure-specific endonuclease subunit SLX1 homolog n=1 Tax=Dorcoceras hygrometricum TaxID=472368 RepID=A0A2Z7AWK4_9LAMI|nr:hypothetical protein F511_04837 [Dorcoceras hygrometricum]